MTGAGRFAPSPSGDLHVGNLRTAVLAWLFARRSYRAFLIRMEDLDRVREGSAERQLADLAALGLVSDQPVLTQSSRRAAYDDAIATLRAAGRVYECFCTRREIQQAASAPHAPQGAYPGTCRNLTDAERDERRRAGRRAALRLRADVTTATVHDVLLGPYTGVVDDLVLRRTDGVPAYNLAVVVDAIVQGVDQVVPVDVYAPGCPPTPETLIHAIETLHQLIEDGELLRRRSATGSGAGVHVEEISGTQPIPVTLGVR